MNECNPLRPSSVQTYCVARFLYSVTSKRPEPPLVRVRPMDSFRLRHAAPKERGHFHEYECSDAQHAQREGCHIVDCKRACNGAIQLACQSRVFDERVCGVSCLVLVSRRRRGRHMRGHLRTNKSTRSRYERDRDSFREFGQKEGAGRSLWKRPN